MRWRVCTLSLPLLWFDMLQVALARALPTATA